jgi:hypothetical protein
VLSTTCPPLPLTRYPDTSKRPASYPDSNPTTASGLSQDGPVDQRHGGRLHPKFRFCVLFCLDEEIRAPKFLGLVLLAGLGASSALGQIANVTNDQATPIPDAGHDYIHLSSETVNPSNGSVSIRIHPALTRLRSFECLLISIRRILRRKHRTTHFMQRWRQPGTGFRDNRTFQTGSVPHFRSLSPLSPLLATHPENPLYDPFMPHIHKQRT